MKTLTYTFYSALIFLSLHSMQELELSTKTLPEKIYLLHTKNIGNGNENSQFEGVMKEDGCDLHISPDTKAAITQEIFYDGIRNAQEHRSAYIVYLMKKKSERDLYIYQLLTNKGLNQVPMPAQEKAAPYLYSFVDNVFNRKTENIPTPITTQPEFKPARRTSQDAVSLDLEVNSGWCWPAHTNSPTNNQGSSNDNCAVSCAQPEAPQCCDCSDWNCDCGGCDCDCDAGD